MNLTNNFDKLNSNGKEGEKDLIEKHDRAGYVRKLTFVQVDGKCKFFNYAHLMDGQFSPEENEIILVYTTGSVKIKGRNLEPLFEALEVDTVKKIICLDKRYVETKGDSSTIVTEIYWTE